MPFALLTFLFALCTMIGPLGIDTYLPSFHAIAKEFDVGPAAVQQTLSVYVFAMACTMLFYGSSLQFFNPFNFTGKIIINQCR